MARKPTKKTFDEHEALLERCAYLIQALRPFADIASVFDGKHDREIIRPTLCVGHLRTAEKAINYALRTDFSKENEK